MPFELHVTDDLRAEQAHRVARGRIAEAGQEFIGDGGAADVPRGLEHRHLQALLCRGKAQVRPLWPAPMTIASCKRCPPLFGLFDLKGIPEAHGYEE